MRISSISENASAGSGKTTELVKRYIKLLYNGVSPEDIYCITFTNKATNQIILQANWILTIKKRRRNGLRKS